MPHPSPLSVLPPSRNGVNVLLPVLIVAAIAAVFQNSLAVPFLLDDQVNVLDNESTHNLSNWSTVLWPRNAVYTAGRPLLNLSFALNYAVGGEAVQGYHIVNILVHALAALTLYGLVRRALLQPQLGTRFAHLAPWIAFGTALVWAVHPLQTASVTYISQRAESLMGLCYLFTLYGFIRSAEHPAGWWPVATVLSCVAGMLVKEVMATAPLIVFLFDRAFIAGSIREAWRRRGKLHLGLAATALVVLALMLATRLDERGVGFGYQYLWHQYARIEAGAVLHYLRLAFLPFPLVFDYGADVPVPSPGVFAFNALFLICLLAGTVVASSRRPVIGFLGCWFFIILAPTSSVVPVPGQPLAENRVYLPLAALTAYLAVAAFQTIGRRARVPLLAIATSCGGLAFCRNQDYRSELRIWTDTVQKRPESARAHCNHGTALMKLGKFDEAVRSLQASLTIQPNFVYAHINLASALLRLQRIDESIKQFQIALRIDPANPIARANLGAALFQAGRREESLPQFQEALRLRPQNPDAQVNMGIVLARLGRTAEALATFEETLRLYPQNKPARDNLQQLRAALQARPPAAR